MMLSGGNTHFTHIYEERRQAQKTQDYWKGKEQATATETELHRALWSQIRACGSLTLWPHVWSMEKHLSVYQSVCRLVLPRYSFTWQGTAKSSSLLIAVVKLMHQCECAWPRHNTKHSGLSVTILVKGSTVEAGAGKGSYCPHCPQTYPAYRRPVESQRLRGGPYLWLSPCWGTHLTSKAMDWRWNLLSWFLCLWDSHRATLVTHCAWLPSLWLQMVGLSDSISA